MLPLFSQLFSTNHFILAGNSLDGVEFGQDLKTDFRVAALQRLNISVSTFSRLLFIQCSSCMNSNFGPIRPRTAELSALESLVETPYAYNGNDGVSTFSRFAFILACYYEDMYEISNEFEIRPDLRTNHRNLKLCQ